MIPRLLLGLVVASVLAGCHGHDDGSFGSVRVEFGAGYATTTSGWYYSSVSTTLVVDAAVIAYGDAEVVDGYWTVVDYPWYPPTLSHPAGATTSMTFATTGIYVLDFHVHYVVDGVLHRSVERLEVHILPVAVG